MLPKLVKMQGGSIDVTESISCGISSLHSTIGPLQLMVRRRTSHRDSRRLLVSSVSAITSFTRSYPLAASNCRAANKCLARFLHEMTLGQRTFDQVVSVHTRC